MYLLCANFRLFYLQKRNEDNSLEICQNVWIILENCHINFVHCVSLTWTVSEKSPSAMSLNLVPSPPIDVWVCVIHSIGWRCRLEHHTQLFVCIYLINIIVLPCDNKIENHLTGNVKSFHRSHIQQNECIYVIDCVITFTIICGHNWPYCVLWLGQLNVWIASTYIETHVKYLPGPL